MLISVLCLDRCDSARAWNHLTVASVCSIVTSPFIVVGMSMQMSVMPNITIYGDVKPQDINKGLLTDKLGFGKYSNRKAIATSEKQIVQYKEGTEPRGIMRQPEPRADLVKSSGQVGHNKPYRAPIYRSYLECIRGLYNQGLLGFYKGNGIRLLYGYLYLSTTNELNHYYLDGDDVLKTKGSYFKSLGSGLFACCTLHFLHLSEARFVLQNRLPNFQTYSSLFKLARESLNTAYTREMLNGMPGYLPILGLLTLSNFQLLGAYSLQTLACQSAILHFLAYPFLTAQRRMEAQSPNTMGMLHPRYNNYLSCLHHMFKEEGFKGMYRGFAPYMVATAITLSIVPYLSEEILKRSPLYGKSAKQDTEDLREEVEEGRQRLKNRAKKE